MSILVYEDKGDDFLKINCRITKRYERKIAQYDLQGHLVKEWDSYSDIEKETGFSRHNICKCCYSKIKQAYGYRWSFI
jgi:hypothetical protein